VRCPQIWSNQRFSYPNILSAWIYLNLWLYPFSYNYRQLVQLDEGEASKLSAYWPSSTYPVGFSKDEKRRLREKSKPFLMENGVLMHMRLSGTPCRVIASNTERLHINEYLHSDAVGGSHLGQTTTINKISAQFWWPGMSNDILAFIQVCGLCQLANTEHKQTPKAGSLTMH